jgi:hypothetical protein
MANGAAVRLPCSPVELPATLDENFGGAAGWVSAIMIELVDVAMTAAGEIEAGGLPAGTRLQGG